MYNSVEPHATTLTHLDLLLLLLPGGLMLLLPPPLRLLDLERGILCNQIWKMLPFLY